MIIANRKALRKPLRVFLSLQLKFYITLYRKRYQYFFDNNGHNRLLFVLIFIFSLNSFSASDLNDLRIINISIDDGLSHNHVTDLIQDSRGFVWASTLNGINRLDGNTIVNYFEQPDKEGGLKNDRVISLCEGPYNNIWSGSGFGGIQILDIKKNKFINVILDDKNALNNVVYSITKLSSGDVICGTRGGVLYRFSKESIKDILGGKKIAFERVNLFKSQKDFSIDRILDIIEAPNELWLIDWKKRLFKIDYSDKNQKEYHISWIDANGVEFTSIDKNKDNTIIFGSSQGIHFLESIQKERSKFQFFKTIANTEELSITGLIFDNQNNIWASNFHGNVFKIIDIKKIKPTIQVYNTNLDIPIRVKMIDNSNVLWFTSKKAGVFKAELSFKNFNKCDYLNSVFDNEAHSEVTTSLLGSNNFLWLGIKGSGLLVYDIENKTKVLKNTSIAPTFLLKDKFGYIWFTTNNGVFYIKNVKEYKNLDISHDKIDISKWLSIDLKNILYNSIEEDIFGNIWAATDRELLYIIRSTDGEIQDIKIIKNKGGSHISSCDIQGIKIFPEKAELWIMQRGCGITIMNYDKLLDHIYFQQYNTENKDGNHISSNTVNDIYFDSNTVWLTTNNGLNKLVYSSEHKKFVFNNFYNSKQGLINNLTKSIEKDSNGNFWVGTNQGIALFDTKTNRFRTFTSRDGLISNIFTKTSFTNHDGSLVFGTIKGFVSFLPNDIELNKTMPKAGFTSLTMFTNLVEPNDFVHGSKVLENDITETNEIVIKHNKNDITIGFSAFHYAIPEKNNFKYMLEGYDTNWVSTNSSKPFASYANLSSGDYILKLKASNNDGIWMDTIKTLKIKVLPAPWRTTWAYVIYFVIILTLVYFVMSIWGKRMRLNNEMILEKNNKEKKLELNEIKLQDFTDISHEFRTPLTLIRGPVMELMDLFKTNKKIFSILLPLNVNIDRMLRLLDQLLDFRKAETDNLKLNLTKGNIVCFLENIINYFHNAAKSKSINLTLKTNQEKFKTWFDEDKLEKIINNLLSNALKHTPKNGNIEVRFETIGDDKVIISVQDSGSGISEENKTKIFDRFFQGGSQNGFGIGLALVKKLVELHKGSISVLSKINQGSTFIVEIPVGENYFFDQIQKQVARVDLEDIPIWVGRQYEEEVFEESNAQDENVPLILIVEDNEDIRSYLERLLGSDFRIIKAENGEKGEESAKMFLPDIIISDILMPIKDGTDMCVNLKANLNTSHIPVIFLTAKSSDKEKIIGLDIGATDYIIKPFDPKELKVKVENILKDLKKNQERLKRDFILNPSEVEIVSPEEVFLQKALEIVEESISDCNFNLIFLCKEMSISRMQLHRKLKKFTGQSTTEFIRSIRIKRAAQLLKSGHLSALEVMYEVGIESSSYFSKAFKKQYGMTPYEYSIKKGKNVGDM